MITVVYNPYDGVNWLTAQRVKSCSHEHVFTSGRAARMYDRGIRLFGHVHYLPAIARCPLSNYGSSFEDWCFYDATYHREQNYESAVAARKAVPDTINSGGVVTCNYKQQGLIVAYKDNNDVQKWTQLTRNLANNESWDDCCEDETAWEERVSDEDVTEHLVRHTKTLSGSITSFTSQASASDYEGGMSEVAFDGDGLEHNTDDFPQIPNAEHPVFDGVHNQHFNVMGFVGGEAGYSVGASTSWRGAHRLYNINDIPTVFPTSGSFYDGKLFGTVNHSTRLDVFRDLQDLCPWFKGFEVFNSCISASNNSTMMENFHTFLNEGRTVYCLAVTDWQNDFRQISDVDGGTNVLYVPSDYDSLSVVNKAKAGMDCYLNGRFVASRFGSQYVTGFGVDAQNSTATFKVSAQAKTISLVLNGVRQSVSNASEITLPIPKGTSNITGEAYFGDGNGDVWKSETKLADDSDFIFTQAIIVKTPHESSFMDEKMIMFALE